MNEPPRRWLIYVADPMCSWCWGFAPVIARVAAQYAGHLPIALVVGGLSTRTSAPMSEQDRREIRSHWEHVNELTGQAFNDAFFERQDFVYNTEPACRAIVAAQKTRPGAALEILHRLQQAFYTENRDITRANELIELATGLGVSRDEFTAVFHDPETRRATQDAFDLVRRVGVNGFPTLLGQCGRKLHALTRGYLAWEPLQRELHQWLDATTDTDQDEHPPGGTD